MINFNNTNNRNVSFTALKISPKPERWPKDVLNAALSSKTVKKIIKADALAGRDTVMSYKQVSCGYMRPDSVFKLNNDIRLSGDHVDFNPEVGDELLAGKIRMLDCKKNSVDKNLKAIKKLCGEIINIES